MENLKSILGLRNNVDQFSNKCSAVRWADKCVKLHLVILGDNDKFWVVCFADAQRLTRIGYEIAK